MAGKFIVIEGLDGSGKATQTELLRKALESKGNKVTKKANEVDKFKAERAQYKKDMKSAKDEASRDSISINKYSDQEVMANKGHKGNFKNGRWVPDRTKYAKKDACGSKMK